MTITIYRLINTLLTIYTLIVVARVLISLMGVSLAHPVANLIYQITEPLLAPIRNRMPLMGPFDFSPMVLIIIIWMIQQILQLLLIWML
jgi:YggT family protein